MATATLSTTTKAYTRSSHHDVEKVVLLKPRPLARLAGYIVLVPLLPKRRPPKPLPAEVWRKIMCLAIESDTEGLDISKWRASSQGRATATAKEAFKACERQRIRFAWGFSLVCKEFKNIVLPLLYDSCTIPTLSALQKFTLLLSASDQKWDSIRRIPYSTPGRWVHELNLSELVLHSRADANTVDALLTVLFPLLPCLARLELTLSMQLSRRAMHSLGCRDGVENLRVLRGVKYDNAVTNAVGYDEERDPLTEMVACCAGLEELEVIGLGMDDLDVMIAANNAHSSAKAPHVPRMYLPRLHTLTLLSTPSSHFLRRLLRTPLPKLRTLVITPYGDLLPPLSLVTAFLEVHGQSLRTLVLHTPKAAWPSVLMSFPPPKALLRLLPNLTALSLEGTSLTREGEEQFRLDVPPPPFPCSPHGTMVTKGHPLATLWVPRPTSALRESIFPVLPYLPNLREVRCMEVRWAKRGMSARALEAGFQGQMQDWARLLGQRKVRLLDADGRERTL